jgi:tryptophanyl-tRNA synthetase
MPDAEIPKKEVVLSGIRATGTLHIGNYLGAIRFFAELAKNPANQCLFFVADLHSLTTPNEDTKNMATQMREIIRWYLAAGIDPTQHIIFTQSSVPATTELNWLLSCTTPMGDLERMPHWKEKSESERSKGHLVNAGLFTYPILMAADILGPGATLVPVGEDQHAHVELARELAHRFNQYIGEALFPIRTRGNSHSSWLSKWDAELW